MTREELKEHCKRQVQQFERVEKIMPVTINDWKRYEEHKLVLELLEQEPRWIPVNERLPENDSFYLVTEKSGRVCTYVFHTNGNSKEYWKRCVVAWMPLPKAYSEVE